MGDYMVGDDFLLYIKLMSHNGKINHHGITLPHSPNKQTNKLPPYTCVRVLSIFIFHM